MKIVKAFRLFNGGGGGGSSRNGCGGGSAKWEGSSIGEENLISIIIKRAAAALVD